LGNLDEEKKAIQVNEWGKPAQYHRESLTVLRRILANGVEKWDGRRRRASREP